ncbi:hypothetical protein KQI86_18445 [Clostridium sp. MSJ-11]|uniref:Head-tail adaptor protein n=1 Tax=Clostridium mobile TaxID=2841512 RepID=A0ABS6ENE9_9CLOT|nr:hypothetical protein [Clostridium mobile]MBU5486292.1 hypothetical protein [Clostridium mobile]
MVRIKEYLIFICIFIFALSFNGCRRIDKKPITEKEIDKVFDIKAAENIVNSYMNQLIKEDYVNASKFYSKELAANTEKSNEKSLKIRGYNINEIIELGRAGIFKIRVTKMNNNRPYTSLEEVTIKIAKEDTDYKIQDINSAMEREAFERDGNLRIRTKNNVDNNLLIDDSGMPNYEFSKEDKGKTNKIVVPKNNYGPMIFSYNGDSIVITTYDKDSYIGLVKIDESMTVQGGSAQDQGEAEGQGAQEGGAQQQNQQKNRAKEKPMGKNIKSLDLLKDSKVEYVAFSQNEKYVIAQYKKAEGRSIRVYTSETGDMIPYNFEKYYPMNKVDVVFTSFDKDLLNYEVIPRVSSDKSIGELLGRWQLDLKEYKVKKV